MDPIIGEIRMFAGNYAPAGWALCDGSTLQISSNDTLFMLIGTSYGGDGFETFALPDLRGRVPVNAGSGAGISPIGLGEQGGTEQVTLQVANLPPHTHVLNAITAQGTLLDPTGNMMALTTDANPAYVKNEAKAPLTTLPTAVAMHTNGIATAGQNVPVSVVQPFTAVNFIIATQGVFPSTN
jgi:microcystin-dependent protein